MKIIGNKSAFSCYLCGSKCRQVRDRIRHDVKRRVFQCPKCTLVQLEKEDDRLNEYYKKDYRKKYSPVIGREAKSQEIFDLYLPFQKKRVDLLKPILKKNFKVLDVGASAGHFLASVKPYVKECVALELNKRDADFIKKKLGFKVSTEPLEKTDLKEKLFDVVTIFECLEHIEDPINFVKMASKLLKPGGYLAVSVPNIDEAEVSLYNRREFNDFYYKIPHRFYFSSTTLQEIMKRAGFKGAIFPQEYVSLNTHLKMMLAGQLASDVIECWSPSALKFNPLNTEQTGGGGLGPIKKYDQARKELQKLWQNTEREYFKLMNKHGITDHLMFIGRSELKP